MSESNDPPSSPPPDDQAPSSPFPDSSLTPSDPPPPHGDPVYPDAPVPQEPAYPPEESEPPRPHGDPVAPEPPATWTEPPTPQEQTPTGPSSWMEPSSPQAPPAWSATEAPGAPPSALPSEGGLVGGDPLTGGTGGASTFPPGYTSPPPPGAGGDYSPPPTAAFGSGAPATGQYVLAGWWRRAGAAIIDGIILTIPFLIVVSALGIGVFADSEGGNDGAVGFIVGLILTMVAFAVVALLYAPIMMSKTNGKTVGRMATGIRVIRADGKPMTFGFAALREIAVKALLINGVAGSFTFGLAGLLDILWPLWDDENRALHDFVVNTRSVMDQ